MASKMTDLVLKRLTQYCTENQVAFPPLKYDDDEPDEVLFTDDLHDWIRGQDLSIRWLTTPDIPDNDTGRILESMANMTPENRARFFNGVKEYVANGGDLKEVMARHGFAA